MVLETRTIGIRSVGIVRQLAVDERMHREIAGRPEQQDVVVVGAEEGRGWRRCCRRRAGSRSPPAGPILAASFSANSRAPMSAPAPGPNGTMNFTVRVGQFCACDGAIGERRLPSSAIAAAAIRRLDRMHDVSPSVSSIGRNAKHFAAETQRLPVSCRAIGRSGSRAGLSRLSGRLRENRPPILSQRVLAMDAKTVDAKTHEFDVAGHRVSPPRRQAAAGARVQAARRGPVPGAGRSARRRLVHERPQHRQASATRCWRATASSSSSLDWRCGREGAYPLALADINYAVRWVKLHAKELKTRPDLVGISGQSSGGHLAMLVAMRPHDPRYTAIALPAGSPALDATVKCVVHVVAGDQSARPLPLRQARSATAQSAGVAAGHHRRATISSGAAKPTWPKATRC